MEFWGVICAGGRIAHVKIPIDNPSLVVIIPLIKEVKKTMKKLISLLVVLGLLVGVAGVYDVNAAEKKVAKKVVTKKVKKVTKTAPMRKSAPSMAPVAPAPPPPPVAPLPPAKAPMVAKPMAAPASLLGLGLNADLSGSYLYTGKTGKGSTSGALALEAGLLLDDPLMLGSLVGLSANAVKYRVGVGGFYGGSGIKAIKAIPVLVEGIINLPADMMGGMETYVGGGVNYVLYGNGKTSGKVGGGIFYGLRGDLGMGMGKTAVEIGWSAVRSKTVSDKGVTVSVSQALAL
jgi:hypothetical protein